jgi:hypothetical protein
MHTHQIIIEPKEEIYEQEEFSYAAAPPAAMDLIRVQSLQELSFESCLAS